MIGPSTIIPGLRYAEPDRAIDFLKRAFGFAEQAVFRDEADKVVHAQLSYAGGMIMLGPDASPDMKDQFVTPRDNASRSTQATYVVVQDADAHHDMAVAAGAEVLKPPADTDYGGRGYTCRDEDGHVWEFGTYDPWSQRN